jgi:hypothetical protein
MVGQQGPSISKVEQQGMMATKQGLMAGQQSTNNHV